MVHLGPNIYDPPFSPLPLDASTFGRRSPGERVDLNFTVSVSVCATSVWIAIGKTKDEDECPLLSPYFSACKSPAVAAQARHSSLLASGVARWACSWRWMRRRRPVTRVSVSSGKRWSAAHFATAASVTLAVDGLTPWDLVDRY